MRAAIIEDDPILTADLRVRCEKRGWTVAGTAVDSESGLHLIASEKPQLVFLDVELEDGPSGSSLADPARNAGAFTVFLTGCATSLSDEIASEYPVLIKPFSDDELTVLLDRVKSLLN
jgi:DNA-binding response OmpR family regulator